VHRVLYNIGSELTEHLAEKMATGCKAKNKDLGFKAKARPKHFGFKTKAKADA